jgi:hypothetical protein
LRTSRRVAFILIAFVASVAVGFFGPLVVAGRLKTKLSELSPEPPGQHPGLLALVTRFFKEIRPDEKAEFWFDVWLNFVGAVFGWCAAYALAKMLMSWHNAGIGTAIVILTAALVGFLGISGYLPYAILHLGTGLLRLMLGKKETETKEDK